VLGPPSLRDEMAAIAVRMAQRYAVEA